MKELWDLKDLTILKSAECIPQTFNQHSALMVLDARCRVGEQTRAGDVSVTPFYLTRLCWSAVERTWNK